MRMRVLLAATAAASAVAAPAAKAITGDDVSRGLGKESEVTVHLRSYYLNRDRPAPTSDLEAWALGGWVGYQSGWIADFLRVGAVAYTSQPLYAPDDKDGTSLLAPGQEGYTALGQAYIALRMRDQTLTALRQLVDQPEVNPKDTRMTPQTFNGYTLGGKIGSVSYYGGYLDKMKAQNSEDFRDMAASAGVTNVGSQAMWMGGISFKPVDSLALRLSTYDVSSVLGSTYMDAIWDTAVSQDMKLKLSGQYMFQSSNGTALTGTSFDTNVLGLKADLQRGPATFSAFYTKTDTGQNYQTPYGGWAGYTYMIVTDFNRAGETAWAIGGNYDFKASAPGLALTVYAVYGGDAINAATGTAASDKTEYDFTLDYRFAAADWADWLKPLWLRGRFARVEEKSAGGTGVTNDFRLIANYEVVFK